MLELSVNGKRHRLDVAPEVPLVFVLRNDLGLKSVRLGCGLEQCGACHVLVDGVATPCCARAAGAFECAEITTLEGLAERGDPLIDAFLARNAAQCGYCLSGILVTLRALLERDPAPSDAAVRAALAGNLCRCGAQPRMLRAVRDLVEREGPAERSRGSGGG